MLSTYKDGTVEKMKLNRRTQLFFKESYMRRIGLNIHHPARTLVYDLKIIEKYKGLVGYTRKLLRVKSAFAESRCGRMLTIGSTYYYIGSDTKNIGLCSTIMDVTGDEAKDVIIDDQLREEWPLACGSCDICTANHVCYKGRSCDFGKSGLPLEIFRFSCIPYQSSCLLRKAKYHLE